MVTDIFGEDIICKQEPCQVS